MTPKQDRVGARTVADLERRINPTRIREDIEAKTRLAIESGLMEAGKDIVSYINASADVISLKGDRLEVESENFNLSPEGVIEAKAGVIGGCEIVDGTLQVESKSNDSKYHTIISGGIISFDSPDFESADGQYVDTAIMQVTVHGFQYLLCLRSKIEYETDGWAFRITPVGMVFRKSLEQGAGEL